jgi:hypothetical protein
MIRYTVFKKTGTHADVLAAVGAADLLRKLDPRILELQDRFVIELRRPVVPADLDEANPGCSNIDRSPHTPKDRMSTILSRMKACGGPNLVNEKFAKMNQQDWSRRVWESLNGRPDFVFSAPLVQLFNPHCGRGYSLLKPSGTNRSDKTKDRWAEPFLEWLRYRGYFAASAGWFTSGDLRMYTPIPALVGFNRLTAAATAFRDLKLGGSSVKVDCRAVLGLSRALIENARVHQRPSELVRGVYIAHYKDMGQTHTFMAMEQLALPNWFELRNSEHAVRWLQTIEEHDTVLRRLNDTHSDEFALLKQYRLTLQWQARDSVAEFVEFLAGYASLLFKRRSLDEWLLPQLSTTSVGPILRRDPQLRALLRHPGFLAVAAALRGSTIGAQAARHNGRADHREIRYGLLTELRRADKSRKSELARAVFAFISAFNAESRRRRNGGLRAATIKNSELDGFLAAIDRLPERVSAGSVLCAVAGCLPAHLPAVGAELQSIGAISA